MNKVVDLGTLRENRAVDELLEQAQELPPFTPGPDSQGCRVRFTGHIDGEIERPKENDILSLFAYDVSHGLARPLWTMRFSRAQWERLKELGDVLFDEHDRLRP